MYIGFAYVVGFWWVSGKKGRSLWDKTAQYQSIAKFYKKIYNVKNDFEESVTEC